MSQVEQWYRAMTALQTDAGATNGCHHTPVECEPGGAMSEEILLDRLAIVGLV